MTWDIWYIAEGFLIWIIPSTYLSHETIKWVCTTGFAVFAFIGFYFRFLVLLLLLYYIRLHPSLPLVFYSSSLLLLSYIPCMFPVWYHLLPLYLLLYVCTYDTVFNTCSIDLDLSIHVCLSLHATWRSLHHPLGSFWLPWILMSKSWSLELVDAPSYWSELHSGSVNHRQTV